MVCVEVLWRKKHQHLRGLVKVSSRSPIFTKEVDEVKRFYHVQNDKIFKESLNLLLWPIIM